MKRHIDTQAFQKCFRKSAKNFTTPNVAKVTIDIMTKHSYLPSTLITDKGSAFTSTIVTEVAKILGITLKSGTTKHPQTIGKLQRTHASLKSNLKMASGEYRHQWHKDLPLVVLKYNTTYHSSIGCEPSKVFHGRIPYSVLDHKLRNFPKKTSSRQLNSRKKYSKERNSSSIKRTRVLYIRL